MLAPELAKCLHYQKLVHYVAEITKESDILYSRNKGICQGENIVRFY
jgi:hypothetical protein